ncbi:MAG: type II toxin-antitoxin system RelE/ParE family toxin [Candidatus Babeliales bacterium]
MKQWEIRYWTTQAGRSPVEKWLDDLTEEQLELVFEEINLLKKAGNNLKLPHSKPLGGGLFELRERRYGFRIYYHFKGNSIIILLAAGDKKSQDRDIKIAYKRLDN